jgi:hypothetical protein
MSSWWLHHQLETNSKDLRFSSGGSGMGKNNRPLLRIPQTIIWGEV